MLEGGAGYVAPIDKTELELPILPATSWSPDLPGHFLYQQITSSAQTGCPTLSSAHNKTATQSVSWAVTD